MRVFLLAALCCATAHAQDADLEVVFDRATSTRDAIELVRDLSPSAETNGWFQPVVIEVQVGAPIARGLVEDLFETGAISVEVVNVGARFAHILPAELAESVARGRRVLVSAEYPSTTPSRTAAARFEAVVGVPPTRVETRANLLEVTASDASALAARLRSAPNVVAVTAR
ncbi:hypothetical protein [Rubrivirga sp.]|uniref:hypothetical protein n=1 Tax=Rubrivirga sp. TaxID=1885344 RepID=UPI003C72A40B